MNPFLTLLIFEYNHILSSRHKATAKSLFDSKWQMDFTKKDYPFVYNAVKGTKWGSIWPNVKGMSPGEWRR